MNRKPVTYHEWRDLLHETFHSVGAILSWNWHRKELDKYYRSRGWNPNRRGKQPVLSRDLWRLAHRAYRVEMQMFAESEAGTSSAMWAMIEMIRREQEKQEGEP